MHVVYPPILSPTPTLHSAISSLPSIYFHFYLLCASHFSLYQSTHTYIHSLIIHPPSHSVRCLSPHSPTQPSVHLPIHLSMHPSSRLSIPHPSVHAPNPASQCFLNTCWLSAKGNAKEYHQISIIPRSYQFYSGV